MEYKILDFDKPTKNGYIYTKKVIEKALKSKIVKEYLHNGGFPIIKLKDVNKLPNSTGEIDVADIVGFATKFRLTKEALYIETRFLIDYLPKEIFAMGMGSTVHELDKKDYVEKYELIVLYVEE